MRNCKKCGSPIVWNYQDHEETGKWRPFDVETDEPHDCPESSWKSGSGGSGGIDAVDAISIGATMVRLEDKIGELNKSMLKILSEIQTVTMRIEGQMPLFPNTKDIVAKPASEPILDPADLTDEG